MDFFKYLSIMILNPISLIFIVGFTALKIDESTLDKSPIYEGKIEERYTTVENGGLFSVDTNYNIIVNNEEYILPKDTWVKLSEGTNVQYQVTTRGKIGNVNILD